MPAWRRSRCGKRSIASTKRRRSQLPTRIGLHVGMTASGPSAVEYQAVGEPANTAARLQELNKDLKNELLVSAAVVGGLEGLVVRRPGSVPLAGNAGRGLRFRVLGSEGAVPNPSSLRERFASGLELYESGNLVMRLSLPAASLRTSKRRPHRLLRTRCAKARGAPFASWIRHSAARFRSG